MINISLGYVIFYNKVSAIFKKTAMDFKRRVAMYRMLEKMTGEPAMLQINEAVAELKSLEIKHDFKSRMWYVYDDVMEKMRSSDANFAKALADYIPQQDTMILAASEQDDITLGFTTLIENNKKTTEMKKTFISALAYPLFLVTVLVIVLYYFSTSVIREMLASIPEGIHLSATSKLLITMSNNFNIWFPVFGCCLLSIIGFCGFALPNWVAKSRKYLEDIPPFNMYRIMVGCGFLFALNSLGKSGFMQIDALQQMVTLAKPYLRHRIQIIMELMADGMDIGQALIHSELNFPDKQMVMELAIQMKYSEKDSLEILSNSLAEDGLESIRQQSRMLNLIITFIVFATIGFLYIGIYGLGNDLGSVQANINL